MIEKVTDALWEDYHISARLAGCPIDQIESFTKALYIATPQQLAFHSAARAADLRGMPNKLAMGGTRGSAKSHSIIAQVGLDDCLRQPQLKALFLRKTQKAAGEQFQDLIDKVFNNVNCVKNTQRILFPNGSKIVIGGYKDPKEIDNYIGIEYDVIYIGEITQIPGDRVEKLLGSLRTSKTNWRPRLYTDFNPGGLGYQAVKKIFIDPWRNNEQSDTHFFETWYHDNPFINPEYRAYLDNLKGPLKEIWCLNNWNIMAGQAFPELDQDIHGFTEEKPDNWPVVVVYDWGYEKPYAVCFIKIDYDNRGWVFNEIYGHGGKDNVGTHEPVEEVAAKVADYLKEHKLQPIAHLAGPDFFARNAGSGMMQPKAYSEIFAEYGIHMSQIYTPAGSRMQGKMLFHSRLAIGESGQPGLKIHINNCQHTWRTLLELTYLEDGSGDVNSDEEDHLYDALRHFCSWRQWIKPQDNVLPEGRRQPGIIDLKSIMNKQTKRTSRRLG
jgi:phage terminase large subunit